MSGNAPRLATGAVSKPGPAPSADQATILGQLAEGVIVTDPAGRIVFVNDAAARIHGMASLGTYPEAYSATYNLHTEDGHPYPPAELPLARAVQRGETVTEERWRIHRRDGSAVLAVGSARPLLAPGGARIGAVLTLRDETARDAAEAALRESEALKAAILDAALDCILTIDHGSRVLEWNPAAERVFGHARGAVLGRDMAELIVPPEHREAHRRGLARYLATGVGPLLGRRIEVEALRADGCRFPAELAITPTSVGGRTLFTAYLRDITDRREAAAALADSEARFRAVADNIPQLAWMADPVGRRRWYNRRWYDYTGQTVEQARGWGWRGVHHPDHLERVVEGLRRAQAAGESWEDTFPLRGLDGGYRWFLSRAVPVQAAGGAVALWFGTNTDITERLAAEAALATREAEYRAIFETAAAGVTEVDARTGRYLRVNHRFGEIAGRTEAELVGAGLGPADVSHPEDRGMSAAVLAAAAADGRHELEKRYLRPDGTVVWVRSSAAVAARDAAGRATRTVAVVQDITEGKRAEQRQALLMAELNHRVKNALATVQAVADQTLRGAEGNLTRFSRDFTARLRALAWAHDLLTARGWEATSLGDVAGGALAPWLPGGGVSLDLRGSARLAVVSPRQAQALVLALHELTTNAVKHGALTQSGGRVELRGEAAADGAGLLLEWGEAGGPLVDGPPARRGFGTRLLERALAQDLGPGSSVELRFERAGLRAAIRFVPAGA